MKANLTTLISKCVQPRIDKSIKLNENEIKETQTSHESVSCGRPQAGEKRLEIKTSSVKGSVHIPSIAFRLKEGCRKLVLGVWVRFDNAHSYLYSVSKLISF